MFEHPMINKWLAIRYLQSTSVTQVLATASVQFMKMANLFLTYVYCSCINFSNHFILMNLFICLI